MKKSIISTMMVAISSLTIAGALFHTRYKEYYKDPDLWQRIISDFKKREIPDYVTKRKIIGENYEFDSFFGTEILGFNEPDFFVEYLKKEGDYLSKCINRGRFVDAVVEAYETGKPIGLIHKLLEKVNINEIKRMSIDSECIEKKDIEKIKLALEKKRREQAYDELRTFEFKTNEEILSEYAETKKRLIHLVKERFD